MYKYFHESEESASYRNKVYQYYEQRKNLVYGSDYETLKEKIDAKINEIKIEYSLSLRKDIILYLNSATEEDIWTYRLNRYENVLPVTEKIRASDKQIYEFQYARVFSDYRYTPIIAMHYYSDVDYIDCGLTMSGFKQLFGKRAPNFDKDFSLRKLREIILDTSAHQTKEKRNSRDIIVMDEFVLLKAQAESDRYGFRAEWSGNGVTYDKLYGECSVLLMIVGFRSN